MAGENVWFIRVFQDRKMTISFSLLLRLRLKCYRCESGMTSLNKGSLWNMPTVPLIKDWHFSLKSGDFRFFVVVKSVDFWKDYLFSPGSAIWFAAQGSGKVEGKDYLSPCRVLLAGMGIDEQLGGYSRHRFGYFSSFIIKTSF